MLPPDFTTLTLDKAQPLQNQLHQQLVEWICAGRLTPGTKLISSRKLATELGISRNTVTQVLEQLKAEGFLTSHGGKGVFVSDQLPSHMSAPDAQNWMNETKLPALSKYADKIEKLANIDIDISLPFTPGVPDLAAFPVKLWHQLYRQHYDRLPLLGYGGAQGYLPLREALAHYLKLSRGVRCSAHNIIITNGAQEALSLCGRITLDSGDIALLENPGYQRVRQAFRSQNVTLKPVTLKNDYIDLKKLQANRYQAKVLYTTPTHQYPLGGIMPASERIQLLDWAASTKTWILEDDYDSEYAFHQKPVAALQGMASKTPVLYMGSFSKTLFPSLRLGYLVVPDELVDTFVKVKGALSGETCLINQAVTADFIAEGHFVRHLRKMRNIYRDKWEHLHESITSKLSSYGQPLGQSAGMHLVLEIPHIDDEQLRLAMKRLGYGGTTLSSYYMGQAKKTGLVLGFANTNQQQRNGLIKALITHLS